MMLSVVLVDDHVALRQGLEVLLERKGVEVLAATGSANEALPLMRRCRPDVAIVDLDLPGESGTRLVERLRTRPFEAKVLIYTGSHDALTLADALETGAEGIVLKPSGLAPLVEALRAVHRGERYVGAEIREIIDLADGGDQLLTKRERDVFVLLAEGHSGEEVAVRLRLSAETVRTHVRNAMGKLQARTRTEAVVRAVAAGEIRPNQANQ